MHSKKVAKVWNILNIFCQLYNFGQSTLTLCINQYTIVICNSCTKNNDVDCMILLHMDTSNVAIII